MKYALLRIIKKSLKMVIPYGLVILYRKIRDKNFVNLYDKLKSYGWKSWYFRSNGYENIKAINFRITDKCNYKCEYCFQGIKENPNLPSANDLVINKFMKILPKIKNASITIVGGEPSIHPRFYEVAKEIVKNNHKLCIITNFSLPSKRFEEIIDLIPDNCKMRLGASLHLSQIDSVDKFIKKATDLSLYGGNKLDFSVASVLTEDNFLILKDVRERLKLNNISFNFQRLQKDDKRSSYSGEIEEYINSLVSHDNSQSKNQERIFGLDTYGLICKAGHKMWRIMADGSVNRCFNPHKAIFHLGNLENTAYTLRRLLPCLRKNCLCSYPAAHGMLTDKWNIDLARKTEKRLMYGMYTHGV
jgi:organic radical activating enzyme